MQRSGELFIRGPEDAEKADDTSRFDVDTLINFLAVHHHEEERPQMQANMTVMKKKHRLKIMTKVSVEVHMQCIINSNLATSGSCGPAGCVVVLGMEQVSDCR